MKHCIKSKEQLKIKKKTVEVHNPVLTYSDIHAKKTPESLHGVTDPLSCLDFNFFLIQL